MKARGTQFFGGFVCALELKQGSSVVIGELFRVVLKSVSGTRVKVSVFAPPDVKILRDELVDQLPRNPTNKNPGGAPLVLTLKAGEGFLIGDDVHVAMLLISDGAVGFRFSSLPPKPVFMGEVWDRFGGNFRFN